ncbi:MAG: hemagglutinin repeat-containing protein [Pasteurellaceae bacterium]|nr:hemagglutinin repeat-containing protein [Pasteurellaceae bacterium]
MPKSISLSKIALALSLCYVSQFSYADIQSANDQTQISKQKGVEIVNIATPTQAGLSYNQYNKFNVDKAGAVLNNAKENASSQLAGQVAKNPNIKQQAASVILNEVVSRNPSTLLGKQEIVGQRADYVLANPNGISCHDCGFINTPRASLVVGKASVKNGALTGYNVTGNKALTGHNIHSNNDIDLIAPTVNLSGNIHIKGNANVILGKNTIHREQDGSLNIEVQQGKGQVLDGKIAGSIQAGRIRIHSTDDRATLNLNSANIKTSEVAIIAGNTKLDGTVTKQTKRNGHSGLEGNRVSAAYQTTATTEQFKKTTIQANTVIIGAKNNLDIIGADIQAKDASIVAANAHLGTTITTNEKSEHSHKSKGRWFRDESENSQEKTVHQTHIKADNVKIVATNGKITGEAVKLDAKNLSLSADKGIDLSGTKSVNKYQANADFKNESAKLKTGSSSQNASKQQYTNSEINTSEHFVVTSQGNVNFVGTKANVHGNLVSQGNGEIKFVSDTVQNNFNVDDKEKYWGGLAGSKKLASTANNIVHHGSDFTVDGKIQINADKGVTLQGSRVIAGQSSSVNAEHGQLIIDSVQNKMTSSQNSRIGTIFNIAKAREARFMHTTTSQGSVLQSQSNLNLVAEKNIDIIGSTISSAGLLDISSLTGTAINIQGAKNTEHITSDKSGFGINAKAAKPTTTFDKDSMLKFSISAIKDLIEGKVKLPEAVKGLVNNAKDNVKIDAEASVSLDIYRHQNDMQAQTHTASKISGSDVNLNAKKVLISGSQVEAAKGNLNIHANQLETRADIDHSSEQTKNTDASLKATIHATKNDVTGTLSATVTHQNEQKQTEKAQNSQLSAKNDVNLHAQTITHKGSELVAGHDINQNAHTIRQDVARDISITNAKNVEVGATLTTAIDKSKAINGSLELNAQGGHNNALENTAKASSLTAGNNINVYGKQVNDVGTQYQAGKNVNINADSHHLVSAQDSIHKDSLSAGVNTKLSASTSDLQTVNADVSVGVKYQQDHSSILNNKKANIQAENVNLHSKNLHSQADITASKDINIAAQQATFTQSQNSTQQKGGGFELNVGVGALVIPAAQAAIPSISVDAKTNGKNNAASEGVSATLKAGNQANIAAKNQLNVQGTTIEAGKSINLSGKTVNVEATHSHTDKTEADVGVGVSVGAKVSDVGLNTHINVDLEHSQQHQGTQLNAPNLNINANNQVTLSGIASNAQHTQLNAKDVALNALKNNMNKTQVSTDFALNGGVSDKKWTPANGSASLDVNVVRNQTHTTTNIKTDNATLNVAGNANFNGSHVKANNVNGAIKGNLNAQDVSDKVKETNVSLAANGSGKFTAYPKDKWQESAKNDWNNGTIAGVKADAKIEAEATRKEPPKTAGLISQHSSIAVQGHSTHVQASAAHGYHVKVNVHPTTHLKQSVRKVRLPIKRSTYFQFNHY